MRDEPVDEAVAHEQRAREIGKGDDQALALQKIRARVLGIEAARHALQDVMRLDREPGARVAGADVGEFLQYLPELPADTARWVLGELQ